MFSYTSCPLCLSFHFGWFLPCGWFFPFGRCLSKGRCSYFLFHWSGMSCSLCCSYSLPVDFFFPTYLFLPSGWFCYPGRTIIRMDGSCPTVVDGLCSFLCNYSLSSFFPFPTGWFLLSCWFLPNSWIHLELMFPWLLLLLALSSEM